MTALFGVVYGALSIDIIKYEEDSRAADDRQTIDVILRCLDVDQSLLLQALPTVTSYEGHHLEVVTSAATPALFALA